MFSQGKTFTSTSDITAFQVEKLKEQIQYLFSNSPFYQKLFEEEGILPSNIRTLEDLAKLPVTEKEQLQNQNSNFLCIDKENIAEYFTTSGTLGEPLIFPLSTNDLERLAYNEYLSFKQIGAKKGDIVLVTVTSDKCFMAGNAYALGARKAGLTVIKTGPGLPEFQWSTILKLRPTIIIAVPSFIIKLIEYAEKNGIDYKNSSVKKALCVGEPLRSRDLKNNQLANKIVEKWPIQLFSTYASTEMSTAFTECTLGRGGHLNPELIIIECLDENNNPVAEGTPGEITATTIGVEAMPLLRFKTGDIAVLHKDQCKCGNINPRIGPIIGRNKQMIKYKGTTLYPDAIKQTLQSIDVLEDYYIEVSTDTFGMDDLTIHMAIKNHKLEIEKEIADAFRSHIRVVPKLSFKQLKEIQEVKNRSNSRKPLDFLDNRTTN